MIDNLKETGVLQKRSTSSTSSSSSSLSLSFLFQSKRITPTLVLSFKLLIIITFQTLQITYIKTQLFLSHLASHLLKMSTSINQAIFHQQQYRRIYNQTCGKMHSRWEYYILGSRVYEWLADHDPVYISNLMYEEITEAINEIFDIILALLDMLKSSSSLLSPIVYYANKFVSKTGIKHNQLFNLLLTSTIVTLKFWSESAPTNNKMIADIFEFPVHDVNVMERRFLCGVDYQLTCSQTEIDTFLSQINIHILRSNNNNNNNNNNNKCINNSVTSEIIGSTSTNSVACIQTHQCAHCK
ncbi:hypothetical protein DFA_09794 [Cavenderia fasciculata]|uniref:Cyclin N-terminal domain-containing protein n=1 Tax=Cavenderia fasciculata TaxID=261658 RepID=F4Q8M2_CACFS|nr:uncharacterized protein DFA_09794 [Cavenderia fasciculata]EGG16122.1 hypothetical protein DFA_09794 [Cavenderia fasciculata]|eukprot:XP_004352458.1 hypothetical protein DFA_09794 [Cavenderia fasciculata]